MKLRRVKIGTDIVVQVRSQRGWVALADLLADLPLRFETAQTARRSTDIVAFLAAPLDIRAAVQECLSDHEDERDHRHDDWRPADVSALIPFEPRSYRDFALFEDHMVGAARGFVRKFWPHLLPVIGAYETITRRTFPALRPKPLWYREPIYYMGNHLAFVTDGDEVRIPPYTRALDYALEIGFVLARELLDATPAEAEAAIGGFVVFNDFSARDVQYDEMQSGFGPQKSKNFCNAISSVVVTPDEVLPFWGALKGYVKLNGEVVSEPVSEGACWSLGEVLAHLSRSQRLYPGEFFGSGTLPGGSGIEEGRLLAAGDLIEIGIDRIGSLSNRVVDYVGPQASTSDSADRYGR
jgi:2-keto-4-pentenoate hydratase/2-oxohepta-3-ene-1,7-dioic acid hydratase in catechol pathway